MHNNSRKAKSRYLQNIVKDKILKLFKLPSSAIIKSKVMYSFLNFKQAKKHNHREPLLVCKKNREPALAIVTLDHFFELIERDD